MSPNFAVVPYVVGKTSDPDTQNRGGLRPPRMDFDALDGHKLTPCHFSPFDEHLNTLGRTYRWQQDLDAHFAHVFQTSALSTRSIDALVTRALHLLGRPTRTKIRDLARATHVHWTRLQYRTANANACAPEIVAFVSQTTERLGRMSVHAQRDFVDQLGCICIEKLKLTLRWHVDVVYNDVLPIPRKNLFMQIRAVLAMIARLFRSGQLQHTIALNGLRYIAVTFPWPDAVSIIYAFLIELGPKFGWEPAGWRFIQYLLTELSSTCQLASAIKTLAEEWRNGARVTLYHARPNKTCQYRAHHSPI